MKQGGGTRVARNLYGGKGAGSHAGLINLLTRVRFSLPQPNREEAEFDLRRRSRKPMAPLFSNIGM